METHTKKKTPQLYSTMQEESSNQGNSEPPEDLPESTSQVEDPQDDMEKDKSSELNDFVSAIKSLGKNAAKSGKVRELEPFNGRDPKKLKTFILQCRLYFRGSSNSFKDEACHITFAISYLWDVAVEWFKPGLSGLTKEPLTWLEDWNAFVEELQNQLWALRWIRWCWKWIGQPPDERQPMYLRILGPV